MQATDITIVIPLTLVSDPQNTNPAAPLSSSQNIRQLKREIDSYEVSPVKILTDNFNIFYKN